MCKENRPINKDYLIILEETYGARRKRARPLYPKKEKPETPPLPITLYSPNGIVHDSATTKRMLKNVLGGARNNT